MANITTVSVNIYAVLQRAKLNGDDGILDAMFPEESRETQQRIWRDPDLIEHHSLIEVDLRSEE